MRVTVTGRSGQWSVCKSDMDDLAVVLYSGLTKGFGRIVVKVWMMDFGVIRDGSGQVLRQGFGLVWSGSGLGLVWSGLVWGWFEWV